MYLSEGAADNQIGGSSPGDRNIISGNGGTGVGILDPGSDSNRIQGNYIGTNAAGDAAVPNLHAGVDIAGLAHNLVGGGSPGEGNLISGNGNFGIKVHDGAAFNRIEGNFVGTDATGSALLGALGEHQFEAGIWVQGSSDNFIGGDTPGQGNVIAGTYIGVHATFNDFATSDRNVIAGNLIGTDATGMFVLGNTGAAVYNEQGNSSEASPQTNGHVIIHAHIAVRQARFVVLST